MDAVELDLLASDAALSAFDLDGAIRHHRRMLRRRRLLSDVEDHLGELHERPRTEQLIVLACHQITRRNAFRFVIFLLGNRVPPRPIAALVIGCGLLPQAKRRRDVWDAMRSFRDGRLCAQAFYWSLETKQRERVNGPDSWCKDGIPTSMRDPLFWRDAQSMLCG